MVGDPSRGPSPLRPAWGSPTLPLKAFQMEKRSWSCWHDKSPRLLPSCFREPLGSFSPNEFGSLRASVVISGICQPASEGSEFSCHVKCHPCQSHVGLCPLHHLFWGTSQFLQGYRGL